MFSFWSAGDGTYDLVHIKSYTLVPGLQLFLPSLLTHWHQLYSWTHDEHPILIFKNYWIKGILFCVCETGPPHQAPPALAQELVQHPSLVRAKINYFPSILCLGIDTQCCEILFYCFWLVQQGHVINKKLQINEKEVIKKDWAIENTSLSSTWWQLGDWVWGGSCMGSFQRQLIKEGSARKLTDSGKGRLRPDSCIVHMVSDVFMCLCWLSMCVCCGGG